MKRTSEVWKDRQLQSVEAAAILKSLRAGPLNEYQLSEATYKDSYIRFDRWALIALVNAEWVAEKDGSYSITKEGREEFNLMWNLPKPVKTVEVAA